MRNTIKNGKVMVINEPLIEKHEEPIKEEIVANKEVALDEAPVSLCATPLMATASVAPVEEVAPAAAINEEENLEEDNSSKHHLIDDIIYKAKHRRIGRPQ